MLLDNSTNSILDIKKNNIDPQSPTKYFSFMENDVELLRITKDEFFIRGEKVPQDEDGIRKVYEALLRLWNRLTSTNKNSIIIDHVRNVHDRLSFYRILKCDIRN